MPGYIKATTGVRLHCRKILPPRVKAMQPVWSCGTPRTTCSTCSTKESKPDHYFRITNTCKTVFLARRYHWPEIVPPLLNRMSGMLPKAVINRLLLRSGDVESNPGPPTAPNICANNKCRKTFTARDKPVKCSKCDRRYHKTKCTQFTNHTINKILKKEIISSASTV